MFKNRAHYCSLLLLVANFCGEVAAAACLVGNILQLRKTSLDDLRNKRRHELRHIIYDAILMPSLCDIVLDYCHAPTMGYIVPHLRSPKESSDERIKLLCISNNSVNIAETRMYRSVSHQLHSVRIIHDTGETVPFAPDMSIATLGTLKELCAYRVGMFPANSDAVKLGRKKSRIYLSQDMTPLEFIETLARSVEYLKSIKKHLKVKYLDDICDTYGSQADDIISAYDNKFQSLYSHGSVLDRIDSSELMLVLCHSQKTLDRYHRIG